MRARSGLFGGSMFSAGLLSAGALAGSPVTFQESGAGVYATKKAGEEVRHYAYLPGVVGEFSYDGAGLAMYSVSTPERIACTHTRSNTDTFWNSSFVGSGATFTVSEEWTVRISWDWAGWEWAYIGLQDATSGAEFLLYTHDTGPFADSIMVTLSPGIIYEYYGGVGNATTGPAPGGGTGFIELDFIVSPITEQPSGLVAQAGSAVELALVADDAESFEWRKNGVPIGGAARGVAGVSGPTLEFDPVSLADVGVYDCVVTRRGDEFVSAPAVLAVEPCLAGDANGDGAVNFSDLNAVLAQFGAGCGE